VGLDFNIFANNDFIGTIDHPIPLNSITNVIPYTIFLYKNNDYRVVYQSVEILSGTWSQAEHTVTFGNDAFANKMYLTQNGISKTCLQVIFYGGPQEYLWRGEYFCPQKQHNVYIPIRVI
jgi:hypothetical protein